MLTECLIAATESVRPPIVHLTSNLKDVGIFVHQFQPQILLRQGLKKSSVAKNCLANSETHIFAAQAGKAIVNVYNREKNNQEATVPFPQKIFSLAFSQTAAVLILGTQDGKLILWEIGTGRISNSSTSHIEPVTLIEVSPCGEYIVSASPDSSIHIWSLHNLIAIPTDADGYGNTKSKAEPISSFSQHRAAISALAVGHAKEASCNIAVSASEDKTCYVWALDSLTILRTILLQQSPQCAIFDPADRAAYIGSSDGSIQTVGLIWHHQGPYSSTSILNTSPKDATTATQLEANSIWTFIGSSASDSAQCITMSYDGTSLVTGHHSGCLVEWDVGKGRMSRQLSTLSGQPVTNVRMLQPVGFYRDATQPAFIVPSVIKPRLDLSHAGNDQQSGAFSNVPVDYTLHVQVKHKGHTSNQMTEIERALKTSEMPQSMMDDAIQSLTANRVSQGQPKQIDRAGFGSGGLQQLDEVQKELETLKAKLAKREETDQVRLEKHIARMRRREAIGLQKRQAFFEAKKQGKNGDDAMKAFTQLDREVDEETDEEAIAAAANDGQVDVIMKG